VSHDRQSVVGIDEACASTWFELTVANSREMSEWSSAIGSSVHVAMIPSNAAFFT
jgi:hypothetical protein